MDDFMRLLRELQSWSPPSIILYAVSTISIVTTVMISRLLSGSRMITMATSYIVLFLFAFVANFLARYVQIAGMTELQEAILATIAGQIPAVLLLFMLFRRDEDGRI